MRAEGKGVGSTGDEVTRYLSLQKKKRNLGRISPKKKAKGCACEKKELEKETREREREIYSREKNVPVSTSPLLLSSQQPLRNWTEERKKPPFLLPLLLLFPLWLIREGWEPIVLVKKRGRNGFASVLGMQVYICLKTTNIRKTPSPGVETASDAYLPSAEN